MEMKTESTLTEDESVGHTGSKAEGMCDLVMIVLIFFRM